MDIFKPIEPQSFIPKPDLARRLAEEKAAARPAPRPEHIDSKDAAMVQRDMKPAKWCDLSEADKLAAAVHWYAIPARAGRDLPADQPKSQRGRNHMSDDITSLRAHLFATLRGIKDKTIDLDQARAINEIGKTLVDTAKVEVDYLRATGGGESSFIDTAIGADNLPPKLPDGITGIVRHRLQG